MFGVVVALAALAHAGASGDDRHDHSAHRGVPARIVANQRIGPYVASVWADSDVGMGSIYVVLDAADGATFTPPSAVRIGIAPVSGRLPEIVHDAHSEPVRHGGRFMADVMFDRPERWNVRVVVVGANGSNALRTQVESKPNASMGGFGLALSTIPFVLMAVVWWRAAATRHRAA